MPDNINRIALKKKKTQTTETELRTVPYSFF